MNRFEQALQPDYPMVIGCERAKQNDGFADHSNVLLISAPSFRNGTDVDN